VVALLEEDVPELVSIFKIINLSLVGGTTRRFTSGIGATTTSRTNAEDEDMEWDEFEG
jgi:hypothetical protein